MAGEHGIKESKEIIKGLEIVLISLIDIAKDGFSLEDDLPKLLALAGQAGALGDAVADAGKAKDELMELDKEEMQEVIGDLYDLVDKVGKAKKA